MKYVIREATEGSDIDLAYPLIQEVSELHGNSRPDLFQRPTVNLTRAEFAERIESPKYKVYLCEVDASFSPARDGAATDSADCGVVGVLLCKVKTIESDKKLKPAKVLNVEDICVAADHRGGGVMALLFEKAFEHGRAEGCVRAEHTVWGFNDPCVVFSLKSGYAVQHMRMERRLAPIEAQECKGALRSGLAETMVKGSSDSFYYLGRMFYEGVGYEENREVARSLYETGSSLGSPKCQYSAAICSMKDDRERAEQLFAAAFPGLMREALAGDAVSQRFVSCCYLKEGRGCEPNYNKALEWLAASASRGNLESQVNLRDILEKDGSAVETPFSIEDLDEAIRIGRGLDRGEA